MKTIYTISFSVLILSLLLFSSCTNQLNVEPEASISDTKALGDINGIRVALTGVYAGMQSRHYYGRNFIAYADHSSDNGKIPVGAGSFVKIEPFYQFTYGPTTSAIGTWERLYNIIARANNIINSVDDVPDGTSSERDRIKGEAIFVRALAHHDLLRLFAHDYKYTADASHDGVPYIIVTEIANPGRNSVAECYELIITDLTNAIDLMTSGAVRSGADAPNFASLMAAKALRARIYQYKGDWEKALIDVDDVILNGGYSLAPYKIDTTGMGDIDLTRIDSWSDRNPTSESIFELELDELDGLWAGKASLSGLYLPQPDGFAEAGPSLDIVNLYASTDVRKNWYIEDGGQWFTYKYPGNGTLYTFTAPVLRLTEMYLIKAEAHANRGEEQQALDAINLITERANAPIITSSGIQLLTDILDERRRELAFEGHRFFDIKRLQQDIDRQDCNLSENCFVPYGDKLYAYPIPQEEIDANSNPAMRQNPDY